MKKSYLLTLLSLVCCLTIQAQDERPPAPPNGLWLYDKLYMDQTEITNIAWLEYLYYLKKDSSEEVYRQALPDTTVWNQLDPSGFYRNNYLRSPGYREYPVVGISYHQALAYCNWRSKVVNQSFYKQDSLEAGGKRYKVNYRLPTEEEWIAAASGGLDPFEYPFGYRQYMVKPDIELTKKEMYAATDSSMAYRAFKKEVKQFLRKGKVPFFNCLKKADELFIYSHSMPQPVKMHPPNGLSFYQMIGNVAEMTNREGNAKGGSFAHLLEDCRIDKIQAYSKPVAWLGFRCIAEVVPANKPD